MVEISAVHERSPYRDSLIAKVADLADTLRGEANACEDRCSPTPELMQLLRTSGLLKALTPEAVGGFQVDPVTELELIEAMSAIDGSIGWTYWALAGSTARAASMLPEEAVHDVFPPHGQFPLIAFQESAFGNVVHPGTDGLKISGQWPFGTGAEVADWVLAIGAPDSKQDNPWPDSPLLAAIIPTAEVSIVDTWDSAGLAGTGTVTYRVDDIVVPWHRTWAYPPPETPQRGGVHFSFRRAAIKHTGFALGVARNSIERFTQHVAQKYGDGKDHAALVSDLTRSRLSLDAARSLAISTVENIWNEARENDAVAPDSYRRLQATARYVTEIASDVCALVLRHGEASMLARQHPLHRNLRDIAAGAAHAEVRASILSTFGADLLATAATGTSV